MSERQLRELLSSIERGETSAAEAWDVIDFHREMPDGQSRDFWLPIISDYCYYANA